MKSVVCIVVGVILGFWIGYKTPNQADKIGKNVDEVGSAVVNTVKDTSSAIINEARAK